MVGLVITGSLLSSMSDVTSLLVAATALGGFINHAGLAISGATEVELRRATALGGLAGIAGVVVVLSALMLALGS
jgi:hypothetical protein